LALSAGIAADALGITVTFGALAVISLAGSILAACILKEPRKKRVALPQEPAILERA